jgi:hypothetical protein
MSCLVFVVTVHLNNSFGAHKGANAAAVAHLFGIGLRREIALVIQLRRQGNIFFRAEPDAELAALAHTGINYYFALHTLLPVVV